MYNPTNNIQGAIRELFPLQICPWDDYYMSMAQTDFFMGKKSVHATKTYFIRKAPFGGSYAILAGLHEFVRTLSDYRFNETVCHALTDMGYKNEFIDYLRHQEKIQIIVDSIPEGSVFFPNEPAIILEGPLPHIRIAEGILLEAVNYASLAITKWHRVVQAASPGATLEFARRRAQNALKTSLYAYEGGVSVSSNADIRRGVNVKIVGTMGHEHIQSVGDEFEAFDKWLEYNPDRPVLLIDTIDTLRSGVPNAIKAFKKHWEKVKNAGAIPGTRNDSGDLAYLSIEERRRYDASGLEDLHIFQTNDLDEYSIEDIKQQCFIQAPKAGVIQHELISKMVWACGTKPGTCYDQPSIGGVAKLTSIMCGDSEKAVIKLANDNPIKTSIPGANHSAHIYNKDTGDLVCCYIFPRHEEIDTSSCAIHPDDENKQIILAHYDDLNILRRHIRAFNSLGNPEKPENNIEKETFDEIRDRVKKEVSMLHWTHRRLDNPHQVKVSLSESLFELRQNLIGNRKLIED